MVAGAGIAAGAAVAAAIAARPRYLLIAAIAAAGAPVEGRHALGHGGFAAGGAVQAFPGTSHARKFFKCMRAGIAGEFV